MFLLTRAEHHILPHDTTYLLTHLLDELNEGVVGCFAQGRNIYAAGFTGSSHKNVLVNNRTLVGLKLTSVLAVFVHH